MRIELYDEATQGGLALAVFDEGDELVAVDMLVGSVNEAMVKEAQLNSDPNAYIYWDGCYHAGNIEKTIDDNIEKYDEDGNLLDLKEHPWTLQELYDEIVESSVFVKPYYVVVVADSHGEDYAEYICDKSYLLDDAIQSARKLWSGCGNRRNLVYVRQYDYDIEGVNDWEYYPYESFNWKEDANGNMASELEGKTVTITYGNISINGYVVLVEDGVMHINFEERSV